MPTPAATAGPQPVPAPLLVLVAIGSVQCGSAVARQLFDTTGPAGTTLLRLGLGSLLFLAVLRPRLRGVPRRGLVAAGVFGLILGAMNLAFYEAIRTVPLGVAVTVEFIGPLAVALAGSRRRLDVLWVTLAGAGVVLLAGIDTGDVPLSGLALAALAGVLWGCYILASARVGRLLPGTTGLALAMPVATLVVVPFGTDDVVRGVAESPVIVVGGLAVAVLSSVVPYSLELAALRRLSTTVFGVLMSLEPGVAALAGLAILGQRLSPPQVLALLLVSAASLGATLTSRGSPVPVVE